MQERITHYDYVVVGAGTMGRSVALYLNLQFPEARCALIEQHHFDHEEGSSHGRIRILRSTYANPFYRDLCLLAIQKYWK
jgi:glycine/D-amino acid oxidase-like deaminating enzyme